MMDENNLGMVRQIDGTMRPLEQEDIRLAYILQVVEQNQRADLRPSQSLSLAWFFVKDAYYSWLMGLLGGRR